MLNSGPVSRIGKYDLGKAITMESPLREVIIEGTMIQLSEGLLRSPTFKGFIQDVNISKSMVRLQMIEAEDDSTRIEMRGVKEEVSGCK